MRCSHVFESELCGLSRANPDMEQRKGLGSTKCRIAIGTSSQTRKQHQQSTPSLESKLSIRKSLHPPVVKGSRWAMARSPEAQSRRCSHVNEVPVSGMAAIFVGRRSRGWNSRCLSVSYSCHVIRTEARMFGARQQSWPHFGHDNIFWQFRRLVKK